MIGQNNAYLYGGGNVEYGQFKLNSQEIRMELDTSTVYATGLLTQPVILPVHRYSGREKTNTGQRR